MKFKSGHLTAIIVLLYLTIPFIGYGLLGTMVTDKHQIEHARIFVDIGEDKMTAEEREEELEKIDQKEKELRMTQYTLIGLAVLFLSSASGLLVNRKKILKSQH